ncbi:FHIPEP family type III secretion protein [Sinomonas gamaensis]|uniref:FHIPEP family type III secretion protein n=1 Tax=Sinomonas gamaensis TaxID=2565624 RepID=UPI0030846EF6
MLSREEVRVLTEGVKATSRAAVEELTTAQLSLAEIHRVLQGLLAERVPINDLTRIYEALTLRAKASTDPEGLVEAARAALGPDLVRRFMDGDRLTVITIDPVLEQSLVQDLRPAETGTQLVMDQAKLDGMMASLSARSPPPSRPARAPCWCAPRCCAPPSVGSSPRPGRDPGPVLRGGHLDRSEHRNDRGGPLCRGSSSLMPPPSRKPGRRRCASTGPPPGS